MLQYTERPYHRYVCNIILYNNIIHMIIRFLVHMRLVPTGNLETLLMQYMNRLNSMQRSLRQLSTNSNNSEKGNLV